MSDHFDEFKQNVINLDHPKALEIEQQLIALTKAAAYAA